MAPVIFDSPSSDTSCAKPKSQAANATREKKTISTPLPNPSLQVTADHNLKQEDAPVYAPGHGEVLLHIKATGVCGFVTPSIVTTPPLKYAGPTSISGEQEE